MPSDHEIPFPGVDLDRLLNPIPAILASAEFEAADQYFVNSGATRRSLVSSRSHAVLHSLIRNQRPAHVVEIGTYHGGTTEMMARAVIANGVGMVHTVSPFDTGTFTPVYEDWADELRGVVNFYPMDSMAFYMEMERQGIRPDLVFVDGDHSYEFALFDMLCAARRLRPGGFIVVDDSIQAGPYFAVQDFIAQHPDWIDCAGPNRPPRDRNLAYDRNRTPIEGTSLMVLRAPFGYLLNDARPRTFGEIRWTGATVHGARLTLGGGQSSGEIHVQCVLTGFGNGLPPEQVMATGFALISAGQRVVEIGLGQSLATSTARGHYTLESWVIWQGLGPLRLDAIPDAF